MCDSETKRRDLPKISLSFFLSLYIYISVYVFKRSLSLSLWLNSSKKRSLSLSLPERGSEEKCSHRLWKNKARAFKFVRSLRGKTRERISILVSSETLSLSTFLSKSGSSLSRHPSHELEKWKKISLFCVLCLRCWRIFCFTSLFFWCCLGLFTLFHRALKFNFFARKKKTWFFRETSSLFRRHSLECVFVVHPFLQKDIYIFEVVLKLSGSCLCVYDGVVRRVLVHRSFLVVVPRWSVVFKKNHRKQKDKNTNNNNKVSSSSRSRRRVFFVFVFVFFFKRSKSIVRRRENDDVDDFVSHRDDGWFCTDDEWLCDGDGWWRRDDDDDDDSPNRKRFCV